MIRGILDTILPTLLVVIILYGLLLFTTNIKSNSIFKAFAGGIFMVLPAIFTMKIVGISLTIAVTLPIPIYIFQLLSVVNEELYKYLAIKIFTPLERRVTLAIFIGAGFSICETLYLSLGNRTMANIRSFTTLPLHVATAIILALPYKRKYILIIICTFIHLLYNEIIHI